MSILNHETQSDVVDLLNYTSLTCTSIMYYLYNNRFLSVNLLHFSGNTLAYNQLSPVVFCYVEQLRKGCR